MAALIIQSIVLLDLVHDLSDLEVCDKLAESVFLIPHFLFDLPGNLGLNETFGPFEFVICHFIARDAVQLPLGLFFLQRVSLLLLLECLSLQSFLFFLTHMHFFNLWRLFCPDSLVPNAFPFVLHLGDGELQIEHLLELLVNVVEGQLNHYLSESRVFLTLLNSVWVPNYIIDLGWITFFVKVLLDSSHAQWNPDSLLCCSHFFSFIFRDCLLLERVNHFMLSHVDEHFLPLVVFGFHYKPCSWLDHSSSFLINYWLSIFICVLIIV